MPPSDPSPNNQGQSQLSTPPRLWPANIQPGNERSIRLVESLGFECEGYSPRFLRINGRWRDHERWALLAD